LPNALFRCVCNGAHRVPHPNAPGAAGPAESREPVRRKKRRRRALGVFVPSRARRKLFAENLNEINLVAPTGFEPVLESRPRFRSETYEVTQHAVQCSLKL